MIEDDKVGIIAPVYAGDMPQMVYEFLSKAKIKTKLLFFICTYGTSYSVAKLNAINAISEMGLQLNYVNAVKMVDNYLPGFEIKNQLKNISKKDIEGQLEKICGDINNSINNVSKINFLQKILLLIVKNTMGKALIDKNAAKKYIVDDTCILCGTCAKVCLANNISVSDKVTFGHDCEVCYSCIHNCPKRAIYLKNEKSAVRFRNEHIELNEIIKSNN